MVGASEARASAAPARAATGSRRTDRLGMLHRMTESDPLRAFGDSAEALEARIADAEARGTPVPPEAHAMLVSLRELARAISDLQTSLGTEPAGAEQDVDGAPRLPPGADERTVP